MTTTKKILHCTLEEAYRLHYGGLIDDRTIDQFITLWTWSAVRYSAHADVVQDRFCHRWGIDAFLSRINRVRKACGLSPYAKP